MRNNVRNVELLINAFGEFPSFHDAEAVRVTLERVYDGASCPTMHVLIRGFAYAPIENDLDKNFLRTDYDVRLIFTGIFGLKLENFNHQNVLGKLEIQDFSGELPDRLRGDERLLGLVKRQQIDDLRFHVKFEYCFGIDAEFFCESVIVDSVNPADRPIW